MDGLDFLLKTLQFFSDPDLVIICGESLHRPEYTKGIIYRVKSDLFQDLAGKYKTFYGICSKARKVIKQGRSVFVSADTLQIGEYLFRLKSVSIKGNEDKIKELQAIISQYNLSEAIFRLQLGHVTIARLLTGTRMARINYVPISFGRKITAKDETIHWVRYDFSDIQHVDQRDIFVCDEAYLLDKDFGLDELVFNIPADFFRYFDKAKGHIKITGFLCRPQTLLLMGSFLVDQMKGFQTGTTVEVYTAGFLTSKKELRLKEGKDE